MLKKLKMPMLLTWTLAETDGTLQMSRTPAFLDRRVWRASPAQEY
jgi:hypothetical protein